MVQRKAPNNNKLGIQATVAKSEKLLLSAKNLKPISSFYDGKTRGHEMKKMQMKRSSSSSLKRNSLPETKTPTPQRSSWSPNYMKSTSSSEAKKETPSPSSCSSQVSGNSPGKRNLKTSSGSGSKQVNSRSSSSSLKLVRTLTKTHSFKVRTQTKKYSRVVLCADMNSQRATCSSTLKDMKSPAYLSLSPGATEAEGTSAIRVCPYTYCSLNGHLHHHAPLPPLKRFLATRRRMLKTQKSVKLEDLSRVKAGGDGEGGGMDFFIEIYAKNEEANGESPDEKQVALSLSDSSPHSEIDFEEGVEEYGEITSMGVGRSEDVCEEGAVEVVKKECLTGVVDPCKAGPESFYNGSEFEVDSNSEVTDMEWEEEQLIESGAESMKSEDESGLEDGYLSESENNVADHGEILADEGTEENALFDKGDEEIDAAMDDGNQNLSDKDEVGLNGIMIGSDLVERIVEPVASREETQENSTGPEEEVEVTETGLKHGDVEIYCDKADREMMDKKIAVCDFSAVFEVSKTEAGVQTEEKDRIVVKTRSIGVQFPEIEEDEEQVVVTKVSIGIQVPDFDDIFYDEHQDDAEVEAKQHQEKNAAASSQIGDLVDDNNSSQEETLPQENPSENHDDNEESKFKINLAETETETVDKMEVEETNQLETEEETPLISSSTNMSQQQEKTSSLVDSKLNQDQPVTCSNPTWKKGSKRAFSDEEEELRKFNPKDPNFLPEVPEPDPEKVDLKHQAIDERKNSEEWMVDYALRQTVTKLAPARNKKVALLVEAFETVTPVPKYKSHRRHSSPAFAPARPMQACS